MTTILADVRNKTLYSDSRATVERNEKIVRYETDSLKLFKHPNKKLIAASFGCISISYSILENLGFNVPEKFHGSLVRHINKLGQSGGILLLNCYNNTVCHIGHDINKLGIKEKEYHQWFHNHERITCGSGLDIAGNVYDKTKDPERAMLLAGLIDKYSDTNIKQISL